MFSECSNGYYGSDCNTVCGNCNKTFPGCIQTNGYCLHGCENDHWKTPKCDGQFFSALICYVGG